MTPKKTIMFVDDDPFIIEALRRQLRPLRGSWDVRFAAGGPEALASLAQEPCQVVVSDMRMPRMNGAQLLGEIRQRWPATVRLILSGQADQWELLDHIGAVHQFLQKPYESARLIAAIERTVRLTALVESPELRSVLAGLTSLPVVPDNYRALLRALDDPEADAGAISELLEADVGLRTKVLQMVNSAFFGLPRRVSTARDAVVLLGLKSLRGLLVTTHVFDAISADSPSAHVRVLWGRCLELGAEAAREAARAALAPELVERCRLGGTLALIGRAVLIRHLPDRFAAALARAAADAIPLHEAEALECGAPQQAVGAYALGLWAFDDDLVEAVACQTDPALAPGVTNDHPLFFVHLARARAQASELVEAVPLSGALAGVQKRGAA